MLDRAVPLLKAGGRIAYVTCSVLEEENGAQVQAFLARHPQFSCTSARPTSSRRLGEHAPMFWQGGTACPGEGILMTPRADRDGRIFRRPPAPGADKAVHVRLVTETQTEFPDCAPIRAKFLRDDRVSMEPRAFISGFPLCWWPGAIRHFMWTRTIQCPLTLQVYPPLKASRLARFVTVQSKWSARCWLFQSASPAAIRFTAPIFLRRQRARACAVALLRCSTKVSMPRPGAFWCDVTLRRSKRPAALSIPKRPRRSRALLAAEKKTASVPATAPAVRSHNAPRTAAPKEPVAQS